MEDFRIQANMAKMAGAFLVRALTGFTHSRGANRSHSGVVQPAPHRLSIFRDFYTRDSIVFSTDIGGHRILHNLIRRQNTEVDASDTS